MSGLAFAAVVGIAAAGCVTEPAREDAIQRRQVEAWTEGADGRKERAEEVLFPPGLRSPPAARSSASGGASPYHRYSHQTIDAPDGRLTRMYWVRAGHGARIMAMIQAHTRANEEAGAILSIYPDAQVDPRSPVYPPKAPPALANIIPGVDKISDLITITADEDVLLEVDQLLSALLNDVPQIEIEGRVVEINFDDKVDVGSNLLISERSPTFGVDDDGNTIVTSKGNDPDTLFKVLSSPLDPNSFLSGESVGALTFAFFENDIKYRAILRAIQSSGNADVLSQPKMAVLNGHRAVVDAGSRTPVLQPVLGTAGNLQQVQVRYEDTGVKLIVTPYLLMDDMIQVDVAAEVSFVSGFIESGASGILNPIISTRNASTVVNVRDGQTFAIGGLISTDEIEVVRKIPILGDVPLLGYLFKTRQITERQSQVIFFVTPRLVRPQAPLFDPGF